MASKETKNCSENNLTITLLSNTSHKSLSTELLVVISDLPNLLVSYKTISENKKQLAFHVS